MSIRERDLTGREGLFIADGTVVLRMLGAAPARDNGFAAEAFLLLENRLAGIADVLAAFPPSVPVYVASAAVFDAVAGFNMHRGVLALGRKPAAEAGASLLGRLPETSLVLAGCGLSNHDNVGSIFRNAAAFGADAVFLDQTSCDPLYRKAIRVSVGSVLSVPFSRALGAQAMLEGLAAAGFEIWGLSPRGAVSAARRHCAATLFADWAFRPTSTARHSPEGDIMQIAIVLYPGFTALDFIGPYESLRFLPETEVRFVWHEPGPIAADSGVLLIGATHTFDETPSPDVIPIPGVFSTI